MLKIQSKPIEYTLTFNQGTNNEVNVSWRSYEPMPAILRQLLCNDSQEEFQKDFAAIVSGLLQIDKISTDNVYDANSLLYGMDTLVEYCTSDQLHKIFDWLRYIF